MRRKEKKKSETSIIAGSKSQFRVYKKAFDGY
jgi:hypothetical protein